MQSNQNNQGSSYFNMVKEICLASESDSEKIVYSTDASTVKGQTLIVAWPSSAAELQKLVRLAIREKLSIVARGGGTGLVGSAVPQNAIVVDMAKFDKIKNLNREEKTVVAEAGVVLDDLNEVLKGYNLTFPVEPSSHASCTIGGMISTNAAGILTLRYGKTSDLIQALTIMDGTGKVFVIEGDEARNLAGTEGSCCIILEAKLKLSPSEIYYPDFLVFDSISQLVSKAKELEKEKDIVAIEYINSLAAKFAGFESKEYLLIKRTKAVERDKAARLWGMRDNLYSVLVEKGYSRIEDPYIPEENIEKFLTWLKSKGIPCFGHFASGIFHPHFRNMEETEKMKEAVTLLNGKLAGEHGIGILKRKDAPFWLTQKVKNLKEKYDPSNILNKGKF